MLRAPLKGFYRFDGAAHSPILEQPELAREFLTTDVLMGNQPPLLPQVGGPERRCGSCSALKQMTAQASIAKA